MMYIALAVVGLILLAYGIFAPSRETVPSLRSSRKFGPANQPAEFVPAVPIPPNDDDIVLYEQQDVAAAPLWIAPAVTTPDGAPAAVPSHVIDWPTLIEDQAIDVSESTRYSMIIALGALSMEWCSPILARAHEQETTVRLRSAVLAAIRDGRYVENAPTLEAAMRSESDQERIVAVEALAAIDRYEHLEHALADSSLPVATSAAYLLLSKYGAARVDELIAGFAGYRHAEEIQQLLAIVA